MTPAAKLAAYGLVLAAALGGGAAVGAAVGPIDTGVGGAGHEVSDPTTPHPDRVTHRHADNR